ncbi:MAG: hypothetical protein AAF682_05725 [Planctomycetota bacterium]
MHLLHALPRAAASACLLLAAQAAAAGRQEPASSAPPPKAELPPSAAADALAAIHAETAPAEVAGGPWPLWSDAAWSERGPWQRWAELLLEERSAAAPDAGRRAQLALLAAEQGRHLDAWEHFAATAGEPEVTAALLPRLLVGIPAHATVAGGGDVSPLEDDVLLRPLLPPLFRDAPYGRPEIREATFRGLVIGDATCDLTIAVEADGVEVTFVHTGGGSAEVQLVLPRPPDREIRTLYVDWTRIEDPPEVLRLTVRPGEDGQEGEAAVWGRFEPQRIVLPTPPRAGEPAYPGALGRGGLVLELDAGDPDARRFGQLAGALGTLFGVPARVHRRGLDAESTPASPATLVLGFPASLSPAERAGKILYVLSAAERRVLAPARPPR